MTDRRWWHGLLLLAPALVTLGALTLYPTVWVVWLSLQRRVPIFDVHRFEGLGNYLFLATDPRFWKAAQVTVVFTVASVLLEAGGGVLAALILRGQRWGSRIALSLLLLAWALPAVVTAKLFEWLYNPAVGLINFALGGVALNWLGDPRLALPGLILADVWRTMPFVTLLCYARLLAIPAEIYEAAQLDGAGAVATLTRITLPLLRRILHKVLLRGTHWYGSPVWRTMAGPAEGRKVKSIFGPRYRDNTSICFRMQAISAVMELIPAMQHDAGAVHRNRFRLEIEISPQP